MDEITPATISSALHRRAEHQLKQDVEAAFDPIWKKFGEPLYGELDKEIKIGTARGPLVVTLRQIHFAHRQAIIEMNTLRFKESAVHNFIQRVQEMEQMIQPVE